ncbi:MAG: hypothetical protein KBF37_05475 [Saprospiraceae bacterium]|nr:hypothetical protein [Saprospiraceae bacterium]MBP9209760.1 hypothetical protein [Saprospiraceae bacterium]MBV6474065.1 hypothetical protein [Saprospiraceae bacterium]
MKTKLFSALLAVSSMMIAFSCGDDDDNNSNNPCSTAYTTELQAEINALTAAAQAYSTNPTQANCIAYKNAAQAYVNALEPYGDCPELTGQFRADWEASLNAARASVAAIQC